jgi:hypothetical protein
MSVFISYSRVDTAFVDVVYRLLSSKGYDAWVDRRSLDAGSRWDAEIERAIREHSDMIVVLSPDSTESQNVADEWSYALDEGKRIIPVKYRECHVPMRLRRLHSIEFTASDFPTSFAKLTNELGEPDFRPEDPIQLARRDGLVFVTLRRADIRIAFKYSDYPYADSFLKTVWFTLLWSIIPREISTTERNYGFGTRWNLRHESSQELCKIGNNTTLLHEIGVEPGDLLEVVLL